MLSLDEVREVLAGVEFDSTSGESGFSNGMSPALRDFRDRVALHGEYTEKELAYIRTEGVRNAQFIAANKIPE